MATVEFRKHDSYDPDYVDFDVDEAKRVLKSEVEHAREHFTPEYDDAEIVLAVGVSHEDPVVDAGNKRMYVSWSDGDETGNRESLLSALKEYAREVDYEWEGTLGNADTASEYLDLPTEPTDGWWVEVDSDLDVDDTLSFSVAHGEDGMSRIQVTKGLKNFRVTRYVDTVGWRGKTFNVHREEFYKGKVPFGRALEAVRDEIEAHPDGYDPDNYTGWYNAKSILPLVQPGDRVIVGDRKTPLKVVSTMGGGMEFEKGSKIDKSSPGRTSATYSYYSASGNELDGVLDVEVLDENGNTLVESGDLVGDANWIDVKSSPSVDEEKTEVVEMLSDEIRGVGRSTARDLYDSGVKSADDLLTDGGELTATAEDNINAAFHEKAQIDARAASGYDEGQSTSESETESQDETEDTAEGESGGSDWSLESYSDLPVDQYFESGRAPRTREEADETLVDEIKTVRYGLVFSSFDVETIGGAVDAYRSGEITPEAMEEETIMRVDSMGGEHFLKVLDFYSAVEDGVSDPESVELPNYESDKSPPEPDPEPPEYESDLEHDRAVFGDEYVRTREYDEDGNEIVQDEDSRSEPEDWVTAEGESGFDEDQLYSVSMARSQELDAEGVAERLFISFDQEAGTTYIKFPNFNHFRSKEKENAVREQIREVADLRISGESAIWLKNGVVAVVGFEDDLPELPESAVEDARETDTSDVVTDLRNHVPLPETEFKDDLKTEYGETELMWYWQTFEGEGDSLTVDGFETLHLGLTSYGRDEGFESSSEVTQDAFTNRLMSFIRIERSDYQRNGEYHFKIAFARHTGVTFAPSKILEMDTSDWYPASRLEEAVKEINDTVISILHGKEPGYGIDVESDSEDESLEFSVGDYLTWNGIEDLASDSDRNNRYRDVSTVTVESIGEGANISDNNPLYFIDAPYFKDEVVAIFKADESKYKNHEGWYRIDSQDETYPITSVSVTDAPDESDEPEESLRSDWSGEESTDLGDNSVSDLVGDW